MVQRFRSVAQTKFSNLIFTRYVVLLLSKVIASLLGCALRHQPFGHGVNYVLIIACIVLCQKVEECAPQRGEVYVKSPLWSHIADEKDGHHNTRVCSRQNHPVSVEEEA